MKSGKQVFVSVDIEALGTIRGKYSSLSIDVCAAAQLIRKQVDTHLRLIRHCPAALAKVFPDKPLMCEFLQEAASLLRRSQILECK